MRRGRDRGVGSWVEFWQRERICECDVSLMGEDREVGKDVNRDVKGVWMCGCVGVEEEMWAECDGHGD